MGEQLKLRGVLSGHGGWVTAIATTPEDPNMILTASRDKVIKENSDMFYSVFLFYVMLDYHCLATYS